MGVFQKLEVEVNESGSKQPNPTGEVTYGA